MSDDPDDWCEHDRVQVALRELAGDGLVHGYGRFFVAIRAALRTEQLLL